jgi:2'-5' RNA ligase
VPSIELLLDDATEVAVRAEWEMLRDAGLPSQARHTAESNRPHITLAYSRTPLAPPTVPGLPLDLTVASPAVFGSARSGYVLVRLVRVTEELLALHRRLSQSLEGAELDPLSTPGAWTPHVTLARRLTGEQLGTAIDLLDVRRALDGRAEAARMWEKETRTLTALSTEP